MLRVLVAVVGLTAGLMAGLAQALELKEGVHYQRLDRPVPTENPDAIEVREFFYYGCPACFGIEPLVQEWAGRQPQDVEFVQTPVLFLKGAEPLARGFFVARALGQLDAVHGPLFEAIHVNRDQSLFLHQGLRTFFARHGVKEAQFDELYSAPSITALVNGAETLAVDHQIRGVPAFVVNGKYLILRNNLEAEQQTFQVIDQLIEMERAAQ